MSYTATAKSIIAAFSVAVLASIGPLDLGRAQTAVVATTSRIVSIGGAITEILYALRLEQRIVGVDTTSLYPPQAMTDKPSVGYMRQLSAEGILSLRPSLIITTEGSGPKETIDVLEAARVPFIRVPDPFTGEGVLTKIRVISEATGAIAQGECLTRAVDTDLSSLAALRKRIERPIRVMFVLSLTNGRPLVAGRNTAADGIITLAGAENAVSGYEGYKLINDEAVIAARPDAILAMERKGFRIEANAVFDLPAFGATPAAARGAFVSMEGLYLLGFGPRTARAARDLAAALYPSLAPNATAADGTSAEPGCQP